MWAEYVLGIYFTRLYLETGKEISNISVLTRKQFAGGSSQFICHFIHFKFSMDKEYKTKKNRIN